MFTNERLHLPFALVKFFSLGRLRFLGLNISASNLTPEVVVHCTWRSLTRLFTPRRAPMNICIYFITYRTGPLALSTDRPYRNTRKFQPLSA